MSDEGGGAPGWIMTFADLMSLLLAFFVLLFSFSNVDDQKYAQVGGSMSEAFGVQRRIDVTDPVKGINFIATEYSSAPPDPQTLNVVPQENLDIDKAYEAEESEDSGGEEGVKGKGDDGKLNNKEKQEMTEAEKQEAAQEALEYMKEQLASEITKGDLNIELEGEYLVINVSEESAFEKGSVEIKQPFKELMAKISSALGDADGQVMISGHTDNEPINSERFRSNWELSTSRAVTVLHGLLETTAIKPENFVVKGHGDTRPKADNSTPEGRSQNRRVEVKIRYDAITINKKREVTEQQESGEFEKSLEELGKKSPAPIGDNNESVFDIIMRGYR